MDDALGVLTLAHVLISLVAMGAGLVVLGAMQEGRSGALSTRLFLGATALTCISGFLFPISGFTPALGVGIVSLAVLAPTAYAIMVRGLAGRWRGTFVLGTVGLVYLNVFVLVAQLFLKVPAMRALAPTQREAPFVLVQLAVLVSFAVFAWRAHSRFQPAAADRTR